MKRSAGQAFIFLLILLPLMVSLCGLLSRAGMLMLRHDQLQNHCDKKLLDALAAEGKELTHLGALNPKARSLINLRRVVEKLAMVNPQYLSVVASLRHAQRALEVAQKAIQARALSERQNILFSQPTPALFRGKITERYSPKSLDLDLEAELGYSGEVGAPLEPTRDFRKNQSAEGVITLFSERFLTFWRPDEKLVKKNPPFILRCQAEIDVTQLEEPWQVKLVAETKAKH